MKPYFLFLFFLPIVILFIDNEGFILIIKLLKTDKYENFLHQNQNSSSNCIDSFIFIYSGRCIRTNTVEQQTYDILRMLLPTRLDKKNASIKFHAAKVGSYIVSDKNSVAIQRCIIQ